MVIRCFIATVAMALLTQPGATPSTRPLTLAIEHATVLPMDRDVALADHTVLVSQGRIVWAGPSKDARVDPGAQRVDARGRYLLPGLADMHVHIQRVEDLPLFVAAGITTVRNMHGGPQHVDWRDRIAKGTLDGPTILTSGPPLGQGFWRDPRFVGLWTTEDAENVVRQQAQAGYDMIKVIQKISPPVYRRLLEAARAAHMPVVGHVLPGIGLELSLAAGQASLEHVDGLVPRSRLAFLFGEMPRHSMKVRARSPAPAPGSARLPPRARDTASRRSQVSDARWRRCAAPPSSCSRVRTPGSDRCGRVRRCTASWRRWWRRG